MKLLKTLSSFKIILVIALHSASRPPFALSEHVTKPWKQLIDIHESSGLNRQKKNPQGRRLMVSTVISVPPTQLRTNGIPSRVYYKN